MMRVEEVALYVKHQLNPVILTIPCPSSWHLHCMYENASAEVDYVVLKEAVAILLGRIS